MNTRFLEAFNTRDRARRHYERLASTAPITSVTDPRFAYVHSTKTDVRATFARLRATPPLISKESK